MPVDLTPARIAWTKFRQAFCRHGRFDLNGVRPVRIFGARETFAVSVTCGKCGRKWSAVAASEPWGKKK